MAQPVGTSVSVDQRARSRRAARGWSGVGTTPPAGARPPLVVEQEYLVTATETVKLADHVNTRVEVTGTLSQVPETAPTQPQRGEVKAPAPPRLTILKVTAIKAVSSECK